VAPTVRCRVRVMFRGLGTLRIGEHVTLGDPDAGLPGAPICFGARDPAAHISIGAHSRLTNGVELTSLERIEIGERCLIGAGVRIIDGDFHGVPLAERALQGSKAAVHIGDQVWIGIHAMVLKGVGIGGGAVIGAGGVVTRDIPAGAVAVGNPAGVISRSAGAC
jgi:acetyltransferase-like isoleucine patch superfamily enzyme